MLDAAAYPHILDAVLAAAPRAALLALRGASRTLKARSDKRLAQHIWLIVLEGGISLTSPGGRLPFASPSSPKTHLLALLDSTAYLDMTRDTTLHPLCAIATADEVLAHLPALRSARTTLPPTSSLVQNLRARVRISRFVSLADLPPWRARELGARLWDLVPPTAFRPGEVEVHVVLFDARAPLRLVLRRQGPWPRRVVLRFAHRALGREVAGGGHWHGFVYDLAGVLATILQSGRVSVCVVGLEALDGELNSNPRLAVSVAQRVREELVTDGLGKYAWSEDEVADAQSRLEVCTEEEHQRAVGDEAAAFETWDALGETPRYAD